MGVEIKDSQLDAARHEAQELWGPIEPGDTVIRYPTISYKARLLIARLQVGIEDLWRQIPKKRDQNNQ